MTLQYGKQTMSVHTLPSISRSKGNQAMKFDRFIKGNMGDNFLQKLGAKCTEVISPRP